MPAACTPLRYPGGKTKLFPLVSKILVKNNLLNCTYIEPFAGGAGLALRLLFEGYVSSIVINDFDYAIYCIWDTIINQTDIFCDFIKSVPLTVTEWQRQKEIYNNQAHYKSSEIGKAAFYLNRTNVSGVLNGGVIGGIEQEGNYKIDARFNRMRLINTISKISDVKDKINLYNWNAKDFITQIVPYYDNCFMYLDPPYVKKGHYLYKNSFNESDHIQLKETIVSCPEKWIATYDNCEFIRKIYNGFKYETLIVKYSVGKTKCGSEVIIYGPSVINS